MKLAVGSDEKALLTDFVIEELKKRGHQVELFGPVKGEALGWPDVGERVALEVSKKRADQGVLSVGPEPGSVLPRTRFQGSGRLTAGTRRLPREQGSGTTPMYWPLVSGAHRLPWPGRSSTLGSLMVPLPQALMRSLSNEPRN